MNKRNTIQRQMVLDAVRDLRNHATADEVYQYVKQSHPSVGKGTIYRNLNILAEDGLINKVEIPNGPDCFDHNCDHHHHVKCIKCGKLFDVYFDEEMDLAHHLHDTLGLDILDYDVLFKGICPTCKEKL